MTFPTELQDRWQHTDPEIRLQALDDLETSAAGESLSTAAQEIFVQIASTDSDNRVRSAAAHKVTDIHLLEQLCQLIRQKDKAVFKFCKEKLNAIHQLHAQQAAATARALQVCKSLESLASKAVGPLTGAQYQYQLSQWQESSSAGDSDLQQRVNAASAILADKVGQFVSDRTQQIVMQQSTEQLGTGFSSAEAFMAALHAPIDGEQMQALEQHLHELQSLLAAFPAPLPVGAEADSADTDARELLKQSNALLKLMSTYHQAWGQLQSRTNELEKLQLAVKQASAKDSKVLTELQKRADKLFAGINWPEKLPVSAAHQHYKDMLSALALIQSKNAEWQKKILSDATADLILLEQNIEQGHLSEAQKLWDKIHNASTRVTEKERLKLQEQLQPYKVRITELQDWKNFAATEKKKELIEKMQHVLDVNQPPPQKAKTIRALQDDWKKLGHSDDNDILWAQFNELAHKAFEPCKEYFKERKDQMSANLKERNRICDELEQFIAAVSTDALNISETTKLESVAQEEWKKYAPVAQNKIKNLQKRFNNILNSLRQVKRKTLQHNADKKLELIQRVEKLLELEDFQEAISAAKNLQNEWKTIGPSPYKEDRNHWNTFRQACDKLFSKRDEQIKQQKNEARKVASAARDTLKKINDLLTLSDEEFLQSKKQFVELKEIFYSQLNPDMKAERRQLIEQHEIISKKYEARQRAAPDRKSLQLINQVKAKAEFCQSIETALLTQTLVSADIKNPEELREQWQAFDAISEPALEQKLEKRFKLLAQHSADTNKLQKLSADNDTIARELCVEMEIQAGMDSPAQDKALRMKIQLNHLKHGFGQNRNAGKSKIQLINELEMQLLCTGPLDPATRSALQLRTSSIKAKLGS